MTGNAGARLNVYDGRQIILVVLRGRGATTAADQCLQRESRGVLLEVLYFRLMSLSHSCTRPHTERFYGVNMFITLMLQLLMG